MPAAQKRVKMLADIVGARGGSRIDDNGSRSILRLDRPVDAEQLLVNIKERAKTRSEAPVAPGAPPASKLDAVPIDRPGALLETKRPPVKKPRGKRATAERAARMTGTTKAASSVENMLYRKGAATAASFRPSYWSFDAELGTPPAEPAPRGRKAEIKLPRSCSPRSR